MKYTYTTISKVGLIREENEDSLGIYETSDGLLIIVCDGLGGNKAGEVASKLAVETIYNLFQNSLIENVGERIRFAVNGANKIIYSRAASDYSLNGMSTTAEVLFIKDNTAYTGHIGDSRIYLFSDEKLIQLTKDHSFVQKLIDEGVLSQKEAEVHPNRNIITRALGDIAPVEIDLNMISLEPGKKLFFFACTDGVTGVINNSELQVIFMLNNLDDISQAVSNLVEERGAPDNYSFVLVKID